VLTPVALCALSGVFLMRRVAWSPVLKS